MNLVVLYNGAFVSGLIIGVAVADLPTDCKTMTVRIRLDIPFLCKRFQPLMRR
jgi:hypothetical protein